MIVDYMFVLVLYALHVRAHCSSMNTTFSLDRFDLANLAVLFNSSSLALSAIRFVNEKDVPTLVAADVAADSKFKLTVTSDEAAKTLNIQIAVEAAVANQVGTTDGTATAPAATSPALRLATPLATLAVLCSQLLINVVDAIGLDHEECTAAKLSLNLPWPCNRPLPAGSGSQSSLFVDARNCASGNGGLRGYWVWTATMDDKGVESPITDNDMCYQRDCSCHQVCPSCAPRGIYKWKFVNNDFGYYTNVNTGSDFNRIGTFSVDEELDVTVSNSSHPGIVVTARSAYDYSCAHPIKCLKNMTDCESKYKKHEVHFFRMYADAKDRLYVRGVTGYASGASTNATLLPDRKKAASWVVFRRINETQFLGRYSL
jgi:hypothetical protein